MAGEVVARLAAAGFELPAPAEALGAYVPAVRSGNLVFTAGQLPIRDGALVARGSVGAEIDPGLAATCAGICALNALAAASSVCSLDRVTRVVKLVGYVASGAGFVGQPGVVDGASSIISIAFGESGRHAREAVGVAELPLGAPVEVSLILEVD